MTLSYRSFVYRDGGSRLDIGLCLRGLDRRGLNLLGLVLPSSLDFPVNLENDEIIFWNEKEEDSLGEVDGGDFRSLERA